MNKPPASSHKSIEYIIIIIMVNTLHTQFRAHCYAYSPTKIRNRSRLVEHQYHDNNRSHRVDRPRKCVVILFLFI